jgi:hypothetical protein
MNERFREREGYTPNLSPRNNKVGYEDSERRTLKD